MSTKFNCTGDIGLYKGQNPNQIICGMEDHESLFFSRVFDNSISIIERNEFVYQRFEYLLKNNKTEDILKILKNAALKDAHGSIIKTLVILSSGRGEFDIQVDDLNRHLIYKYGH